MIRVATPAMSSGRMAGASTDVSKLRPTPLLTPVRNHPSAFKPLPGHLRGPLERRYGFSLAGVRVHTGAAAVAAGRRHHADALAVGASLLFGRDRYQPGTAAGRRLIEHEVVHVLQQALPGIPAAPRAVETEAERLSQQPSAAGTVTRPATDRNQPLRNAASLKRAMEDELDDFFVNMANVWPAITRDDQPSRQQVFNDMPLRATARAEASPMDLLRTYLLLRYGSGAAFPAHFAALLDATDRVGTHEARIFAVFRGINAAERRDMRDMPGVTEVLFDELSGNELSLAVRLLQSDETQSGQGRTTARSSVHLERDDRLNVIAEVRRDDSVDALIAQIEDGSFPGLIDDTSLWANIADNMGVAEVWYLRMVARAGQRRHLRRIPNSTGEDPYVTQIWNAVKGAGTKEADLVRVLTRVNAHPQERRLLLDEPWFAHMLQDELSGGDLRDARQAIGFVASAVPAIRGALISAIDREDMVRIRELLQAADLSDADRAALRTDPKVMLEMGDELSGPMLAETSILLTRRQLTALEVNLLTLFYARPIDVAAVVTLLSGLSEADQRLLHDTPGIFFMMVDSPLSTDDSYRALAALRSNSPEWQTPGSRGTHRAITQNVSKELAASITAEEIRIPVRGNIDYRAASSGFSLKSAILEDWTRAIDRDWNRHFELASGPARFPLVFVPYMARGISNPTLTLFPYDNLGRRSFVRGQEMHLFVGKDGDDLPDVTFSHEFGHVIGNPDEYALTPDEYLRFRRDTLADDPNFSGQPTQPAPRGGQSAHGMMASQYRSRNVYARHAGAATEIVNMVRDQSVFPAEFVVTRVRQ